MMKSTTLEDKWMARKRRWVIRFALLQTWLFFIDSWLITVRYIDDWYADCADWYAYQFTDCDDWYAYQFTDWWWLVCLLKYIVSLPSRLDRPVYKLTLQTGWALSLTWLAIYQSLALNHRTILKPLTPRPLPPWPQNPLDSTPDTRPSVTPELTSLHWNFEPLMARQSCNTHLDLGQHAESHRRIHGTTELQTINGVAASEPPKSQTVENHSSP